MVKPIDTVGVYEEGLEFIEGLHEHEKERVCEFLSILKVNRPIFPEQSIPDDAPEKLKNEAAKNRGKFYRGASRCDPECPVSTDIIGFEWYQSNDRSLLYVWRLGIMKEVEK